MVKGLTGLAGGLTNTQTLIPLASEARRIDEKG